MSRVVVGLAYSDFGDLGTEGRPLSRKMKNDASKTLDKWTKKHHDTLEFCNMNIGSTCNNL
jgi:hypothetical protein